MKALEIYLQESLVGGKRVELKCVRIGGKAYTISRGAITTVSLEDEWYDGVDDPEATIEIL